MIADNMLFFGAFTFYFLATVFYIIHLIWRSRAMIVTGKLLAFIGLAANTMALIARTLAAGHLPVASMYEFGMVMVWLIVVFSLIAEWRLKLPALGAFMLAIAFLLAQHANGLLFYIGWNGGSVIFFDAIHFYNMKA